ncbi:chorismate synthase [Bengtsoniella intestinalis]|uniref:chorismate synthase n=1 Tax=Bengtsoniella intestinalis TaxID=3073143 RepID=UPI00391EEA25
MASYIGNQLHVSVFGQSHGTAIGVTVDGLPAGEAVDLDALYTFLCRRKPGTSPLSTPRQESDFPSILSGIEQGKTCGAPLCAVIENKDQRSRDYGKTLHIPRPGHADYTAWCKWGGEADMRGGGHFSGRLTAPLCIAGGIALQLLERRGIYVGAHILQIATAKDTPFPLRPTAELLTSVGEKDFPVLDDGQGQAMQAAIVAAASEDDSVGGLVECAVIGLPAGLGEPMFGGMEGRLSTALFGIPAVKGVSFGAGFDVATMRGSENNDPFTIENDTVVTTTNHAGGILGGITTAMPLTLQLAFKPTPSIAKEQQTVDLSTMTPTTLSIVGRHDPCIVHRAVPVVEAVVALVVLDMLLEDNHGII